MLDWDFWYIAVIGGDRLEFYYTSEVLRYAVWY